MQCGLYELDITPRLGSDIPGYFHRRISDGIRERLYAHALYMEQEDGAKIVIVTADVVSLPGDMADEARSQIAGKLDMDKACVLLAATHSHTAGPVWTWEDFAHRDPVYIEFLGTRLIDAAVLAAGARGESVIGYSRGFEDRIAFYRDFVMGDGSYKTNPGMGGVKKPYGTIDPEVGVLRIDSADGAPRGALVNYTCHCDCVGGSRYSSDYPGALRDLLKKVYGEGFVTVFVNGFCGNINHCDYEMGFHDYPDHYRRMGRMLAAEVIRTREVAEFWPDAVLAGAHETLTLPTREPSPELLAWSDSILSAPEPPVIDGFYAREARRYEQMGVQRLPLVVQTLRIGDLALYGMPGEIYVEYGKFLKDRSPSRYTMAAGLANGCVGYIPIPELFQPGIYEARLCSSSQMIPEAGGIMAEKLLELAGPLWQTR